MPLSPYTQLPHSLQHLCEHHMHCSLRFEARAVASKNSETRSMPLNSHVVPSCCSKTTRLELLISFLGPCLWACQQGLHWIRFPQGFFLGVVVACLSTCTPSVPTYTAWLLAIRWLASSVFLLVHRHTLSRFLFERCGCMSLYMYTVCAHIHGLAPCLPVVGF